MKNEWNIVGVAVHQAILQLVTRGLQRLQDVAGGPSDVPMSPVCQIVCHSLIRTTDGNSQCPFLWEVLGE